MKTEPTEALKEIKHCAWIAEYFNINDGFGSHEVVDEDDAINIANIAFREGQSNPKIKQLEWERNGPIHYVNQYNPIGYTAAITKWGFGEKQYSARLGLNDSNNSIKIFNSLDEAKDFVQKDFEARIKECLITE